MELALQRECVFALFDPDPVKRSRVEHFGPDKRIATFAHEQHNEILRIMCRHISAVAHVAEKIATDRGGIGHGRIQIKCVGLAIFAGVAAIGNLDLLYRTSGNKF